MMVAVEQSLTNGQLLICAAVLLGVWVLSRLCRPKTRRLPVPMSIGDEAEAYLGDESRRRFDAWQKEGWL